MIRNVAVLGAGVMGEGIAQLYATAGFSVFLYDIKKNVLQIAMESIANNLLLQVEEKIMRASQQDEILKKITITTDLKEALQDADFITEAIPENLDIKVDLFKQVESLVLPETIIASNTSTIPLAELINKVKYPERMIITHFMNPAQFVPLVEVVKNEVTSKIVINETMSLMKKIGKSPILLKKDVKGFIVNRLQTAVVREAFHLVNEGVVELTDIDTVISAGPGFRWAFIGPMEMLDYGGLDTWKKVVDNLAPELSDTKCSPEIINNLVEKGHLGIKSGKGIYSYPKDIVPQKIMERNQNFIRLLKLKKYN